jgi:hypothetical protein
MSVSELRHASVTPAQRSKRGPDGSKVAWPSGEERLMEHARTTIRRLEEVMDALIADERATEPINPVPVDLNDVVATAIASHAHELQLTLRSEIRSRPLWSPAVMATSVA